jgi:alpha/beta superfamily hydrolase
MKKRHISLILFVLLMSACSNPTPAVQSPPQPSATTTLAKPAETATLAPPTETSTAQPPTKTPTPSPTATTAATPTPAVPRKSVEVPYEDRVIRGTLLGDGEVAVILAPMWTTTRSVWMSFARHIAQLGFTALAFDFPGAGGSTGDASFSKTATDVAALVDFLNEQGYERIVCMGASVGGGACYEGALLRPDIAGLVIVSSPFNVEGEEAAVLTMPKLFISGDEPDVTLKMKETLQLIPEPKEMVLYKVTAHGTDIFHSDSGDEFRDLLVDFLVNLE